MASTLRRPVGLPVVDDRKRIRALTVLTIYVTCLMLIPARLVFAPLGGIGKPSILVAGGALFIWCLQRLAPSSSPHDRQPIRVALYIYFLVYLLTYLLGHARGLPHVEGLATDRALITTTVMMGVSLLACDGLATRKDLDLLLRRITFLGAIMAVIGILQSKPGFDLVDYIKIPGLSLNFEIAEFTQRGSADFTRVKSTALHPIEFGVAMAMLLPISVHYALYASTRDERIRRWIITALIGLAIPFSLSRSGAIGLVFGMIGLLIVWRRRIRIEALAVTVITAVALKAVLPGLLGTLKSLFLNASDDPSVQGRTQDYTAVAKFVSDRPWFGRGPRTFLPDEYFALDNQYLDTLITTGWVGVAALLILLFVPLSVAGSIYRKSPNDETRHLAQALSGSVLVAVATSFTFDFLSFTTVAGLLAVVIGVIGALRRLDQQEPPPGPTDRHLLTHPRQPLADDQIARAPERS